MEENVALDSNKQKQFMKSIKGLKRLMKKSGHKAEKLEKKDEVQQEKKRDEEKIPQEKDAKKKRKPRGLVYLSHIPHGFYEHEMSQYFKQFGVVTNVRVIRSKRTGRSKGHAFVEFKNTDVAQVVAETMNNYLMGKRLIKAVYIPPKDQRKNAKRMNWNDKYNPGSEKKLQMKKAYNSNKSVNDNLKIAKKLLSNLFNTKNRLKEKGIDYDFFTPVDIPEALSNIVIVKEEKEIKIKSNEKVKEKQKQIESNGNNDKKDTTSVTISNKVQSKEVESKNSKKKNKKQKKKSIVATDNTPPNKESIKTTNEIEQAGKKVNKKHNVASISKPVVIEQGKKQQKTKNSGVKPPEDFIKLGVDADEDSNSSHQFDSDEFANSDDSDDSVNSDDSDDSVNSDDSDDSVNSDDSDDSVNSDDSDDSENSDDSDDSVNSDDKRAVQNSGDNKKRNGQPAKNKNEDTTVAVQKVHVNRQNNRQQQQNKRKGPERGAEQPKKPKFEKQIKKKLPNKEIMKKK